MSSDKRPRKTPSLFTVSTQYEIIQQQANSRITVREGWNIIHTQAIAEELRPTTLRDYNKFYFDYAESNEFKYVSQFNAESMYKWLNGMGNVQASTKRIRLKALKACLTRLFNARAIKERFYKPVVVKVNETVKEGTTQEDIEKFLSCIDLTNYYHLRDASMVLLIWYTGIRAMTLAQLTVDMVDFEERLLVCPSEIMKNHHRLVLPLNDTLIELLSILVSQNDVISSELGFDTDLLFFTTKNGNAFLQKNGEATVSKRLAVYSKEYGIDHLNTHAIRRGFAKRLLNEGVSVPVISKALGHSDLSTTTKYLNISEAELINELRRLH